MFDFKPVTIAEWPDLQALFAGNPFRGCWCMYWRMPRKTHQKQYGEPNRHAMEQLIQAGHVPGIIAYHDNLPAGWCSVAPREEFPSLDRSPTLKRVDEQPVWSIVCFFVAKPYRWRGLTKALIRAAIDYAAHHGAHIIEAYPLIPEESKSVEPSSFMGLARTFQELGFIESARRSRMRPVMRYTIST